MSWDEVTPKSDGLRGLRASPAQMAEPTPGDLKILAYARLDFDNYTFFVQTLHVVLGRKSNDEFLQLSHHLVDVHLSLKRAISRRHAKIFYNFATQRFEISVLGRNGAFVNDSFVERGVTVPLLDSTKIQIGDIPFTFVLPSMDAAEHGDRPALLSKFFNPADALNLRTNIYAAGSPKVADPPRRNPKAEIVRRLLIARRKSLASSSTDEINALLKELEAVNDADELDDEVRLLWRAKALTKEELDREEGDIDELVKQHNLSEGVALDDDTARRPDFGLDLKMLDSELASLAPEMDRPADVPRVPRMGKPALIQPPTNRIYGRVDSLAPYAPQRPTYPRLEVPVEEITSVATPNPIVPHRSILVSVDFVEQAPVCAFKTDQPLSTVPKKPLDKSSRRVARPPPKDVPDQFKAKPALGLQELVSSVLQNSPAGLTLADIHDAIRNTYPYYNSCPDGWQFSVSHHVRFNKVFCVASRGPVEHDWLYKVDTEYLEERERVRQRQQEVAAARAKAARAEGQAQGPGYLVRPGLSQSPANRDQSPSNRDPPATARDQLPREPVTVPDHSAGRDRDHSPSIRDQLAANRASPKPEPKPMDTNTKRLLTYLQKELFTLYKARNLLFSTAVTTEIITKALATTIAQVNTIGAKAGCGDNALAFLVDKAPQQVTKILDIALTKSIKENGKDGPKETEKAPAKPGLTRPSFASAKHQAFGKPGDTVPQFLLNKPR